MPDRLSLLDKDVHINALPLHKLLHKICKCNHTEWPHVALCGSEKQAFHKTGLLHLMSLSTAPLKDWKWELALPWVSQRWLRYLAMETEMTPETEGMKKEGKKRKTLLACSGEQLLYFISQGASLYDFSLLLEWSLLPQQLRREASQQTT